MKVLIINDLDTLFENDKLIIQLEHTKIIFLVKAISEEDIILNFIEGKVELLEIEDINRVEQLENVNIIHN